MSIELKFTATARADKNSSDVQHRQKLVRRIDKQIGYGRKPIERKKGMYSVECQDLDRAEAALCKVRGMALNGDINSQLMAAASEIRRMLLD
jgi:hypothetical protein